MRFDNDALQYILAWPPGDNRRCKFVRNNYIKFTNLANNSGLMLRSHQASFGALSSSGIAY